MIGETRRQVVVSVVTVVMALLRTGEAQEGGECHLPSGSAASCVDISRCSHLNKLIANLQRPFPGDVTLLIRDSFLCGAGTDSVSVCCPTDGVSPALEPGPSHQDREGCGMQQGAQAECVTYIIKPCSSLVGTSPSVTLISFPIALVDCGWDWLKASESSALREGSGSTL